MARKDARKSQRYGRTMPNMVTSFNELVGNIRTSYMMGPNHKKLIVTTVDRYLLILS